MTSASHAMPASAGTRAASPRMALGALLLATLLSSLGTSIANVGLPTLARTFDAPFSMVQWIVIAYLLAITALAVGAGRLGDIVGRRRLLLYGITVFTVGSVACGAAPTLPWLIAARILQGAGAAAMMALALALVAEAMPARSTGRAIGTLGTMSAIGTALGPSLGGVLLSWFGWRALFLVNVPLGVIAVLLAARYLPADPQTISARGQRFDVAGTLLLATTLALYALAVTLDRGRFGGLQLSLLLAAVATSGLFVMAESRAEVPLIRLELLRDGTLRARLALSVLVSAVIMTTLVVGPFHLARGLGRPAMQVGIVMSIGPIVAALVSVPAGRLADRLGAHRTMVVGLWGLATGSILLAALPTALGIAGYILPVTVATASYATFQTAHNTMFMAGSGAEQRGAFAGMLSVSRNLGLISGAAVLGAVFARAVGTHDVATASAEAIVFGMRTTFAVAAGLIGVALMLARRAQSAQ